MIVLSDCIVIPMKQKIAVSLDEEVVAFLDAQARGNRSEYLNTLLSQQLKQQRRTELIAALKQDSEDPEYLAEIQAWDCVAGDGLDAEG
jgi:Arc/MetJ-type ribon-helix-helix transcriptional regulator